MQVVFFNCSSLISLPDISNWNIFNSNIRTSYIESLLNLKDKAEDEAENIDNIEKNFNSIPAKKIIRFNSIYLGDICFERYAHKSYKKEELKKSYLSSAYNMRSLFAGCSSLQYLPNISKWNLIKTTDISAMFSGCTSLISLPDISNWYTQNITNFNLLFYNCSSLKKLPDFQNGI